MKTNDPTPTTELEEAGKETALRRLTEASDHLSEIGVSRIISTVNYRTPTISAVNIILSMTIRGRSYSSRTEYPTHLIGSQDEADRIVKGLAINLFGKVLDDILAWLRAGTTAGDLYESH